MRYKYIITIFYILGTLSLYAAENDLGDILQKVGEKEALVKPIEKKKKSTHQSSFVFVDKYDGNGMGKKDKSESYKYENKPRFKFKFNSGAGYNNLVGGQGTSGSAGAGGGMGGGGRR